MFIYVIIYKHNMFVQNMPSLAVAMVVAMEKNIEKKSKT